MLDTTTETWIAMPSIAGAGPSDEGSLRREVHTAGMDAVVVGGVDWSGRDEGQMLGDAWIWRSGRSPGAAAGDDTEATTEDGDAEEGVDGEGSEGERLRHFVAATVLDDGGGPELCLGGVATSLPPQCGGPPVEGWDWAAVAGEESAAGTTWGDFEVIGTFDGTTFTLTEEPRPVDPSDDPELLDPPPDMDRDFTAPCPEPAGGWPAADPAVWDLDALNRFTAEVRSIAGFAGFWYDNRGILPDDPTRGVYTVAIAGGPGVEAEAAEVVRDLWGGPTCITPAERTYRELEQALDEARALVEDAGKPMLNASIDEVGNQVQLQIVAPAPRLQLMIDEQLGEGTVVLFSALRRLA